MSDRDNSNACRQYQSDLDLFKTQASKKVNGVTPRQICPTVPGKEWNFAERESWDLWELVEKPPLYFPCIDAICGSVACT
jgi:hypothetical protein